MNESRIGYFRSVIFKPVTFESVIFGIAAARIGIASVRTELVSTGLALSAANPEIRFLSAAGIGRNTGTFRIG